LKLRINNSTIRNMGKSSSPILSLPFPEGTVENANGNSRKRKLIAFGWYGGKFSHLAWLLPLLPQCHHYCEPFAGSAAVLLNRQPSPVETYNDVDGEVANFFRVLREQSGELIKHIGLTPFSREEFSSRLLKKWALSSRPQLFLFLVEKNRGLKRFDPCSEGFVVPPDTLRPRTYPAGIAARFRFRRRTKL
jgi:hypothetical protein